MNRTALHLLALLLAWLALITIPQVVWGMTCEPPADTECAPKALTSTHTLADALTAYGQANGRPLRPRQAERLSDAITDAARRYKVDPYLLAAIGWRESRWRAHAVRDEGPERGQSCGLWQQRAVYSPAVTSGRRHVDVECTELRRDLGYAAHVAARKVASLPRDADGLRVCAYNSGDRCVPGSVRYAQRVDDVRAWMLAGVCSDD